jgi:hypothetical protein
MGQYDLVARRWFGLFLELCIPGRTEVHRLLFKRYFTVGFHSTRCNLSIYPSPASLKAEQH